jgi:acyl dehydratase
MSQALKLDRVGQPLPETRFTLSPRDCALYALGVGSSALPQVWEAHPAFAAVPAMAVLPATKLVMDGLVAIDADYRTLVHGAQRITLHRPLPTSGHLLTRGRIVEIQDKGKGAVVLFETETYQVEADGEPTGDALFSTRWSIFCRTQGGFGGSRGEKETLPEALPDAPPVAEITEATRPDQALLYRLNGDTNPLHVDPDLAAKVGFKAPILHGLCTYGYAVRAAVDAVAGGDGSRLAGFSARFADVVYPGEVLTTTVRATADALIFVLDVRADGRNVLDQGVVTLRA